MLTDQSVDRRPYAARIRPSQPDEYTLLIEKKLEAVGIEKSELKEENKRLKLKLKSLTDKTVKPTKVGFWQRLFG